MHERLEKKAQRAYTLAQQYQHRVGFAAFCVGFLFDIVTLVRIDRWYEQTSLAVYMITGTVLLVWIALLERHGREVSNVAFSVLQFVYGALTGTFLVLYGRSGTLEGSVFFLSGLVLLLVGNELLRSRYRVVLFRVGMWYVLLTAYITLQLPLLYGRIGFDVFQHGLITAALCGFVVLVVFRATRVFTRARDFFGGIVLLVLILLLYWVSYATHSIPPVPLSLQSAFIAHTVAREGNVYTVTYEQSRVPWFRESSPRFTVETSLDGPRMYCFSQIYAPATLSSPLQHRWEVYDAATKTWNVVATIPFSITGGRSEGYRAYSYITLHSDDTNKGYGWYRCSIETTEGFLVGRRMAETVWGEAETVVATY